MPIARNASTQVAMIEEVTAGTTPATPALTEIRVAGKESFFPKREFVTSKQWQPGMNVVDQMPGKISVSGGFSFEMADDIPDMIFESALRGAFTTNVLKNGTTPKSMTAEVRLMGGPLATPSLFYKVMRGLQVNTLNINAATGQIVTGDVDFLGMNFAASIASPLTGQTYVAATARVPYTAVSGFAFTGSSGITTDKITQLSYKIDNKLNEQHALGSVETPFGIGMGTFNITGSIEAYFDSASATEILAYLGNTSFNLTSLMGSVAAQKTKIEVPKAKFTSLTVNGEGEDGDVMLKGEWRGFLDTTDVASIVITRNQS